jgi:CBS-domain-containing membrane protein
MLVSECMKHNVFFISDRATIREAAAQFVAHHIGLLPVINEAGKLIGVVGLRDLLTLEMPDFFELLPELDFVHDFGAVETTRPTTEQLNRPVTTLLQPATLVHETSGLLMAYALMLKHHLHDLPVVSDDGKLVGIASRVDIGTAILATWQSVRSESP